MDYDYKKSTWTFNSQDPKKIILRTNSTNKIYAEQTLFPIVQGGTSKD